MILETSKDVLNLSIAFSVVLVTSFVCWLLYYVIATVREARQVIVDVRRKINIVEEAIVSIRAKLESGVSALTVAAASMKQVIGYFMEKRAEAAERREEEGERSKGRRR